MLYLMKLFWADSVLLMFWVKSPAVGLFKLANNGLSTFPILEVLTGWNCRKTEPCVFLPPTILLSIEEQGFTLAGQLPNIYVRLDI